MKNILKKLQKKFTKNSTRLTEEEAKEIIENFERRTSLVSDDEMFLGDLLTLINIADSVPFGKLKAIQFAYKLGCLRDNGDWLK